MCLAYPDPAQTSHDCQTRPRDQTRPPDPPRQSPPETRPESRQTARQSPPDPDPHPLPESTRAHQRAHQRPRPAPMLPAQTMQRPTDPLQAPEMPLIAFLPLTQCIHPPRRKSSQRALQSLTEPFPETTTRPESTMQYAQKTLPVFV